MQKTLFIKLSIIAGLCCIFAIGLNMLTSLVYDRQQNAESVLKQIAKQHVYPQQIIVPFIAIPSTVTTNCSSEVEKDNTCIPSYTTYEPILAVHTQNMQNLTVSDDTYKRGIYHAISFNGNVIFEQQFLLPSSGDVSAQQNLTLANVDSYSPNNPSVMSNSSSNNTNTSLKQQRVASHKAVIETHRDKANLIIPVSDLRGVKALPIVTINGQELHASYPDTPILSGLSYIEVAIPPALMHQPQLNITIDLPLSGISHINTIPTGQNFEMTMTSNWKTPYFFGQALPDPKEFTDAGFTATWQNQYLSLANNQNLRQCLAIPDRNCGIDSNIRLNTSAMNDGYRDAYDLHDAELAAIEAISSGQTSYLASKIQLNGFAVSFAKPNDIYRQTERTMKYALLLILVSFGTFFLFEVLKSARIHPIQYLMVGSALLVFYVLLLPLTEQIPFWQAYLAAALACVGLIGWYTYYVLGSVKRASIFTLLLSVLYAGFYGILTSEDMNLLLGAIFCFILLASVMYLTRKIDWYKVV